MSQPEEDDDQLLKGPSLSADGRLEERMQRVEPAGGPGALPVTDAPLELVERAPKVLEPRVEEFRAPAPARRSRAPLIVGGLLAVGVALLVTFLVVKPKRVPEVPFGVSDSSVLGELGLVEQQPIIISSTPTGATVTIGERTVGTTPWAGDNVWRGETPVILELKGYQRWEGKLEGGKPLTLDVHLKR